MIYSYDGKTLSYEKPVLSQKKTPVTAEEIYALPVELQPQLTGNLAKRDLSEPIYSEVLWFYKAYKTAKTPEKRKRAYRMFRQGLDIHDLDPVLYKILGTNPNTMGYWFPKLVSAIEKQVFFQISPTKIIKVPLTLLQMTRLEYGSLTSTTIRIVDEYCYKVFSLDETKDYFVKTGTLSPKYNFRNAHVHGTEEVRELGEYLLLYNLKPAQQPVYSRSQAFTVCQLQMSGLSEILSRIRKTVHVIYQGMPLHTEYRVFVDFDTNEVLAIHPYWNPDVMKQRLGNEEDADSPHNIHDYAIFQMHEKTLMKRYHKNRELVITHIEKLIPSMDLPGQWSIDVMQNSDDFYIIDMALAVQSTFKECIPEGKLKAVEEDWMPKLS